MKKILSILTVILLMVTLVGCGNIDRLNYKKGLKGHVELCELEGIKVDTKSADYLKIYNDAMESDLAAYTTTYEEGTVAKGDIANIDYAGKVDGVAFTGGTATKQELTIGSGTFIEGFEEQLIGVKIGDTVDIKVTFPANYGDSTDLETGSKTIKLSGQKAVFTVKINSVKRPFDEINDDFAVAAGFKTADEYLADLEKRSIKNIIVDYIMDNSTVKSYPADKEGNCYAHYKQYYTDYAAYYNATFEDFLTSNGMDEATFKNEVLTQEVVMYAAFDKLGFKVTDESVAAKVTELAKLNETTEEEIKKAYDVNYIEYIYVNNAVVDALYEKANIVK